MTHARPSSNRRARQSVGSALALVVAVACLIGAGVLGWQALRPVPGALTDLDGNSVVLDEEPDVAAADLAPLPQSDADDGVGRFQAPTQGLDVPLVAMNIVRDVINPPTLTDAFVIRGFGMPAEPGSGLVVVAMHAVRGGNAPGNAFFEMGATESPVVIVEGDVLRVDGVDYTVTATKVESKGAVSTSAEIWGDPEGRDGELVVITCLQRTGERGAAADNLVIFAERAA